jgi:hypothetical protein
MTTTQQQKKKKNNYGKIRTSAELDKAIQSVHARQRKLGKSLGKDVNGLWQRYQPSQLVSGFMHQAAPLLSWTGIGLGLVRGVKRLIGGRPNGK